MLLLSGFSGPRISVRQGGSADSFTYTPLFCVICAYALRLGLTGYALATLLALRVVSVVLLGFLRKMAAPSRCCRFRFRTVLRYATPLALFICS